MQCMQFTHIFCAVLYQRVCRYKVTQCLYLDFEIDRSDNERDTDSDTDSETDCETSDEVIE